MNLLRNILDALDGYLPISFIIFDPIIAIKTEAPNVAAKIIVNTALAIIFTFCR